MVAPLLAMLVLAAACASDRPTAAPPSTSVAPAPPADRARSADHARLAERASVPLRRALAGFTRIDGSVAAADRARLEDSARALRDEGPHASDPIDVRETDGRFVTDAQAAWTLALAGQVSGDARDLAASWAIIDAWVRTADSTANACPRSGACSTSLMVSRSAPALVLAAEVLWDAGHIDAADMARFHRWLRTVILPAASDRDNNWGDAGTFLRAVAAASLGDRDELEGAARRWRDRLDLIEADGRIPEEIRRGKASLMYSQDALDYKVATADVLARAGLRVWDARGRRGGTLRAALELVAHGLEDPESWPVERPNLRIPDPSGVWAIAARQWPTALLARLTRAASPDDGLGHSAVIWTSLTHQEQR